MDVAFKRQKHQVVRGDDKHVPHEPLVGPQLTPEETPDAGIPACIAGGEMKTKKVRCH